VQAIADYSEAIRIRPTYEDAFFNRGLVFEKSGDTAAALADFQSYHRLVPNDPAVSAAIARVSKQKP